MPRYRITFVDGHTVERDADSGTIAKMAAKHDRQTETGASEPSDPRVKVVSVDPIDQTTDRGRGPSPQVGTSTAAPGRPTGASPARPSTSAGPTDQAAQSTAADNARLTELEAQNLELQRELAELRKGAQ